MNGWNIAWLVLTAIGMGVELQRHGEEKEGEYNFFHSLIAFGIVLFILIKAGLFN